MCTGCHVRTRHQWCGIVFCISHNNIHVSVSHVTKKNRSGCTCSMECCRRCAERRLSRGIWCCAQTRCFIALVCCPLIPCASTPCLTRSVCLTLAMASFFPLLMPDSQLLPSSSLLYFNWDFSKFFSSPGLLLHYFSLFLVFFWFVSRTLI